MISTSPFSHFSGAVSRVVESPAFGVRFPESPRQHHSVSASRIPSSLSPPVGGSYTIPSSAFTALRALPPSPPPRPAGGRLFPSSPSPLAAVYQPHPLSPPSPTPPFLFSFASNSFFVATSFSPPPPLAPRRLIWKDASLHIRCEYSVSLVSFREMRTCQLGVLSPLWSPPAKGVFHPFTPGFRGGAPKNPVGEEGYGSEIHDFP